MSRSADAAAVLELLGRSAASAYLGEPVSQLDHALQCAHLARAAGADDELVLAALLHDVGHMIAPDSMDGLGARAHEEEGARFLGAHGFSPRVAELVRAHVQGKRYLTGRYAPYRQRLSESSRHTLDLQGGPMTAAELCAFEADALHRDKVQLRKLDDLAKQPELAVAPLEAYRTLVAAHLARAGS